MNSRFSHLQMTLLLGAFFLCVTAAPRLAQAAAANTASVRIEAHRDVGQPGLFVLPVVVSNYAPRSTVIVYLTFEDPSVRYNYIGSDTKCAIESTYIACTIPQMPAKGDLTMNLRFAASPKGDCSMPIALNARARVANLTYMDGNQTDNIAYASFSVSCPPQPVRTAARFPILLYHRVETGFIEPVSFEEQLVWLRDSGYTTIDFRDLRRGNVPNKPVILTFDDSYESQYLTVLPLLQRYGMKATFYVITDSIGNPGKLTWEQLAQMRDAGMEIAPHTEHHVALGGETILRQYQEIFKSWETLYAHLGVEFSSFAYPMGSFNAHTLSILKAINVPYALTTVQATANMQSNTLVLPRLRVLSHIPLATLIKNAR